jgi:hypothetical protein
MKKNSEALDEENVCDYEIGNDTMEPNPLQRNEPPSKKIKNAQGASSSGMKLLHDSPTSYIPIMIFIFFCNVALLILNSIQVMIIR